MIYHVRDTPVLLDIVDHMICIFDCRVYLEPCYPNCGHVVGVMVVCIVCAGTKYSEGIPKARLMPSNFSN